jgi:hypothetical protein
MDIEPGDPIDHRLRDDIDRQLIAGRQYFTEWDKSGVVHHHRLHGEPLSLDQPSNHQSSFRHEETAADQQIGIGHVAISLEPRVLRIVHADDGHASIVKGAAGFSLIAGTNGGTNDGLRVTNGWNEC